MGVEPTSCCLDRVHRCFTIKLPFRIPRLLTTLCRGKVENLVCLPFGFLGSLAEGLPSLGSNPVRLSTAGDVVHNIVKPPIAHHYLECC